MKLRIAKKAIKFFAMNIILILIISLCVDCSQTKSKIRGSSTFNLKTKSKGDGDVDANDVPNISVHLEDRDGDPLNFVKFNDERRDIAIRYSNLEMKYNSEKRALMKLITHQNAKLAELNEIARITIDILDGIAKK